jgi:branched-chain amino acid transport system substrate-binding protein
MKDARENSFCAIIASIIGSYRVCLMKHESLFTGQKTLFVLLAAILLISCGNAYDESKIKRVDSAKKGQDDVVIAVVWPQFKPPYLFPEGVDLAVQEINEKGGVWGRRLRAVHYKDTDKPGDPFDAQKIADRSDIIAVVGHFHSDTTLSALITYEYSGILLLIGGATNPLLLDQGFEYVFRPIPNDRVYGEKLAQYAQRAGYKQIAIIDNNTLYGNGLADTFYQTATDLGLSIVIHRGYPLWQDDFRPLIAQIQKVKFDAIFLAAVLPRAGVFIKQLRQMGVEAPIIAGEGLSSQELIDIAGKAAEGTVVPTMFRPKTSDPAYLNFIKAFRKKFERDPDQYAVLGYDTINLLDFVMTGSNSTVPLILASILRHTRDWQGIMGSYSFEENGELSERKIYFKRVRDGQFVDIEE